MEVNNELTIQLYMRLAVLQDGKQRSQYKWDSKIMEVEEKIRHLEKPYTTTEIGFSPTDLKKD